MQHLSFGEIHTQLTREIAKGKVHFDRTSNSAVEEWIEAMAKSGLY